MQLKTIEGPTYLYEYNEKRNKIGSGSFANVYWGYRFVKATRQKVDKVAIKLMSIQKLMKQHSEGIKEVINNEVKNLCKLAQLQRTDRCHHFIQILDCLETPEYIILMTELCDGNLEELSPDQRNEEFVIKVMHQIFLGLEYLHRNKLTHRDLKPENIFYKDGIFKIGDLGFSSSNKFMKTVLGTPPYMAPQIFKQETYNEKVDIWAAGLIFHELLFNQIYYMQGIKTHADIQNKVKTEEYICKHPISPEISQVIAACLTRDKLKRPSAADILGFKLFASRVKEVNPPSQYEICFTEWRDRVHNLFSTASELKSFGSLALCARVLLIKKGLFMVCKIKDSLKEEHPKNEMWKQFVSSFEQVSKELFKRFKSEYQQFSEGYKQLIKEAGPNEHQVSALTLVLSNNVKENVANILLARQLSLLISVLSRFNNPKTTACLSKIKRILSYRPISFPA